MQQNAVATIPPQEAVSLLNPRGLTLRGILNRVPGSKILILAHGFTSDKDAHGRFPRLAEIANRRGWSTLAFDFSGCGESDDAPLTVEREIEDLRTIVNFTRTKNYQQLALLGNSLGARICLSCADLQPDTMILIGAALNAVHYRWEEYFSISQLEELRSTGMMHYPVDRRGRTECLITQQTLDDFATFDQKNILAALHCPILLIYGDSGWEEQTLLATGREALPQLPQGSRLEVIAGEEHGCRAQFDQVLIHLERWLQSLENKNFLKNSQMARQTEVL